MCANGVRCSDYQQASDSNEKLKRQIVNPVLDDKPVTENPMTPDPRTTEQPDVSEIHAEFCRGYNCNGYRCEVKEAAAAGMRKAVEKIEPLPKQWRSIADARSNAAAEALRLAAGQLERTLQQLKGDS